jgi:UDP-N-acetylglucosamine 2-epimerase (non-hydrolysing)
MISICVITGSRADEGLLAWPRKCLKEDGAFAVRELSLHGMPTVMQAQQTTHEALVAWQPDWMLILGDRYEILGAALAAHLLRIRIAHLCGGDVTEGSYDDAMRDCISRMATLHFVTSEEALGRLLAMGAEHVHLVGNPGLDAIRHGDWKRGRPWSDPYVVVSYQAETSDDTVDLHAVEEAIRGRRAVWITPNPDRGSDRIPAGSTYPHAEFLNLLYHCEEFIGNSSAIFYEAPELGVRTRLIGKRQQGRVRPWGDGHASERMVRILKAYDREHVPV